MQFEDQMIIVETAFGRTRVCVTGEALHVWWGEGVGPQDAVGLLAANAEQIAHLAAMKREADAVDDDGIVMISAMDVED